MKLVNSGSLNNANGAKFELQRPVSFPDAAICERVNVEVAVPIINNNAAPQILAAAGVLLLFQRIFSSWTMAFGEKAQEVVDNALSFDRMRQMHGAMTQRDLWVRYEINGTVEYDGQLKDFTSDAEVPNGGTATLTLVMSRSFVFERLGAKQSVFAPGGEQMRQLALSFQRGEAWTYAPTFAENGAASVAVVTDDAPDSGPSRWSAVPRLAISTKAGQEVSGPDGGGALLAAWEASDPAASSDLALFTLTADGRPLHDNIHIDRVVRGAYARLPLGGFDLNTLVTMLYDMQSAVDLDDLQVARAFEFRQSALDIPQPALAWLYVPAVTAAYCDGFALANTAEKMGGEVKGVSEHVAVGYGVARHVGAVMPISLITRTHPLFGLLPGRVRGKGQSVIVHVPDPVVAAIRGKGKAAGQHEDAALVRAIAKAAQAVPGATSAQTGETTETLTAIAQAAAPADRKGSPAWLGQFGALYKSLR